MLSELARGGMGVLYLAEHSGTGKRHAVKVLLGHLSFRPDALERFRREARAAARIDSPHVVQVTDADGAPELGGAPFLVMELLDGVDLAQHLAQRGTLAPAEVVWILGQAAHAIERAHAVGIVHRDLKPNNLFLHRQHDGSTIVKVLDYGIAKTVAGRSDDVAVTASGAVLGTPTYMAPEQARGGQAIIGPATDVWALGIIAYELLAGRGYWPQLTTGEIIAELIGARIPPPSTHTTGLPHDFDRWFARSCAPDPAARFGSVREQVAELGRLLGVSQPAGLAVVLGTPMPTPAIPVYGSPQPGPVLSPEAYTPTVAAQPTQAAVEQASTTGAVVHSPPFAVAGSAPPPSRWPIAAALVAVAVLAIGGTLLFTQLGSSEDEEATEGRQQRDNDRTVELVEEEDDDLDLGIDLSSITLPQNTKPAMPAGQGPHVVTGYVQTTGITETQAMATVEAAFGDIRGCYRRLLKRAPGANGRLSPMITIDGDGKVIAGVVFAIGGLTDPGLRSCVKGVLRGRTFPKPAEGLGTVQYTFWLAP